MDESNAKNRSNLTLLATTYYDTEPTINVY